jgi:hypothetical protein
MAEPHFRVGQRVLCIDASPNPLCRAIPLVRGRIYTIRAVDLGENGKWKSPGWGVHLESVLILYPGRQSEWAFNPKRFRPIFDRPTNIEIFRRMLHEQPMLTLSED